MFIPKEVSIFLSKSLRLSTLGIEQDWAIESANRDRVVEFIILLETKDHDREQSYAIMALILASYDEYLSSYSHDENIWLRIVDLLNIGCRKYDDLLLYWALPYTEGEVNTFNITYLIRVYLTSRMGYIS